PAIRPMPPPTAEHGTSLSSCGQDAEPTRKPPKAPAAGAPRRSPKLPPAFSQFPCAACTIGPPSTSALTVSTPATFPTSLPLLLLPLSPIAAVPSASDAPSTTKVCQPYQSHRSDV